jgi:hypothetical protein
MIFLSFKSSEKPEEFLHDDVFMIGARAHSRGSK